MFSKRSSQKLSEFGPGKPVFTRLLGWCSGVSNLLPRFTLLMRNRLREMCIILKAQFGDLPEEISQLPSPVISFPSATSWPSSQNELEIRTWAS